MVSCVLLEMSLAFLGILCNLLVVTTVRHQVAVMLMVMVMVIGDLYLMLMHTKISFIKN